jgi:hypothetical protein
MLQSKLNTEGTKMTSRSTSMCLGISQLLISQRIFKRMRFFNKLTIFTVKILLKEHS